MSGRAQNGEGNASVTTSTVTLYFAKPCALRRKIESGTTTSFYYNNFTEPWKKIA